MATVLDESANEIRGPHDDIMSGTVRLALKAGVSVPVIYYGGQLVAAPVYAGYSFLAQVASELGSDSSSLPAVFNTSAFLTAAAMALAAWGYIEGLRRIGVGKVLAYRSWRNGGGCSWRPVSCLSPSFPGRSAA